MYTYVYTYLYICMDMSIEFGSKMVLSTPMWINIGSIWGSLLEHFRSILKSFWEFWEGLPRYLQKASKKIEKNTSQASSWGLLELKLELLGAKMAAKSAKMGQHDRQDGHFGINLAAFGSIWGAFWSHLGKHAEYWKTSKNIRFLLVFWELGGQGEQFWSNLALCWAILDAILEQLGLKMEAKSDKMSQNIETVHFTMCFWHPDAQIAIGVAENGLAQGSPGRERPLRDVPLHWVWARGGGRAVKPKDLRLWGLRL